MGGGDEVPEGEEAETTEGTRESRRRSPRSSLSLSELGEGFETTSSVRWPGPYRLPVLDVVSEAVLIVDNAEQQTPAQLSAHTPSSAFSRPLSLSIYFHPENIVHFKYM